jgi:transaldolase/glucose-6-phosphate isomerase
MVSIEVSPYLAMETDATISEAKRLWGEDDRKNLMIKVPATEAGLPPSAPSPPKASTSILLCCSRKASTNGPSKPMAANGGDVARIASVASFFVSRIDSAVDKLLDGRIAEANDPDEKARLSIFKGKVAIANAKLAYQRYKRLFAGERWNRLAAKEAKPQRLLWASTGTKNKAYSDLRRAAHWTKHHHHAAGNVRRVPRPRQSPRHSRSRDRRSPARAR